MIDWAGWWIDLAPLLRAPFKPVILVWRMIVWIRTNRRQITVIQVAVDFDRNDPEWQAKWIKLRSWFIGLCERVLGKNLACMKCGNEFPPGMRSKMDVDHIVPIDIDPSKALDPDNCQILCESCNSKKGANGDTTDYRPESIKDAVRFGSRHILEKMVA